MKKRKKTNLNLILILILALGMIFVLPCFSIESFNSNQLSNEMNNESPTIKKLKSAGYWIIDPIIIEGESDWDEFVLEPWFSGGGTEHNPYVIENVSINGQGISSCIRIEYSWMYFIIKNSILYNAYGDSPHVIGIKNAGIFLYEAGYGRIMNNTIQNNHKGIYLASPVVGSCYNTVINNTITNNHDGGIYIERCDNNDILQNNIEDNQSPGIIMWGNNNTIKGNNIKNNPQGCYIGDSNTSNNNTLYMNYFINNYIQAEDRNIYNSWDNGTIGNYWSDYTGQDKDDDGIGDSPYISGNIKDNFPIWDDGEDIFIDIISPLPNQEFGTISPGFHILCDEPDINSMWYTIDGGLNNFTFTEFTGYINQPAWNDASNGPILIQFYIKDNQGVIGYNEVSVIKSTFKYIFQGYGVLHVEGKWYKGESKLYISDDLITIEIGDQSASWEITKHYEWRDYEYFYGEGSLGKIYIIIYRGKDILKTFAIGNGVVFYGTSTLVPPVSLNLNSLNLNDSRYVFCFIPILMGLVGLIYRKKQVVHFNI